MDITLSWLLLAPNGIMAIDDYLYNYPENSEMRVKTAVDFFMNKFQDRFEVLQSGYRIFLRKIV